MEQQRTFALPEGLVSALLTYLGTKPHAEVHQLIAVTSQTVQAQLTPEELATIRSRLSPQASSEAPTTPLQAVPDVAPEAAKAS